MSAFAGYNPVVNAVYFISVLGVAMFVNNPIIQALAFLGGICFLITLGKKHCPWFYALVFVAITVTNPLFSHNGATPLFFLNGNPITLEALLCGAGIGLMIVSVLIWCACLSAVLTDDKIMFLFGKVIPKSSLILSASLRFVPILIKRSKEVYAAQRALGIADNGLFCKLKLAVGVFSSVAGWAFENAIDTSAAMKARGYKNGKRSSFLLHRFYMRDTAMLIVILVLLTVCIIGVSAGAVEFDYYPALSAIDCSALGIITYTAFGILGFLPFILELKEAILWKLCIYKI